MTHYAGRLRQLMDPKQVSTGSQELLIHVFNVSSLSDNWEWIVEAGEALEIPAENSAARINELIAK
jgi:hypothetical protein